MCHFSLMQALGKAAPDMCIVVISDEDGKGTMTAQVPKEFHDKIKANDWLKNTLDMVGGRGGGKADSAQGQIPDASKVGAAVEIASQFIASKL
jgi:alanyl-tRNA synthetase